MVDLLPLEEETDEQTAELREQIRTTIHRREEQGSTGIGDGLAFPHARIPGLRTTIASLVGLAEPLPFDSIDDEPVVLVCMVVVPAEAPTVFLKIMSQLVQYLGKAGSRQAVLEAASPGDVIELLRREDLSVDVPVRAHDVMRPSRLPIYPDTPLVKVTDEMLAHRLDAVPVIDRDGQLVGEITCDLLFRYGVPEFLAKLKSVSFISEFDPFEKYFEQEASSTAQDVMNTEPLTMSPEATMLEIVFALAVQKHLNVYIVDTEHHVVGVVDRISVLDRILNL
jgi:PTS system nitrogen regulatory IIA component